MRSFSEYLKDDTIRRYVEYFAHSEGIDYNEAARKSLARMYNFVSTERSSFAIMTAFRGERKLTANRASNKLLESEIRNLGWGFTPILGAFKEKVRDEDGHETGHEITVQEESYLISGSDGGQPFRENILKLVRQFEQQSAIIKYANDADAYLLDSNGSQINVGKWSQNRMAEFYTLMKKGPANRRFNFEAAGDASRSTRMAVDAYFKSLNA